jgi:hypothetical protein
LPNTVKVVEELEIGSVTSAMLVLAVGGTSLHIVLNGQVAQD